MKKIEKFSLLALKYPKKATFATYFFQSKPSLVVVITCVSQIEESNKGDSWCIVIMLLKVGFSAICKHFKPQCI